MSDRHVQVFTDIGGEQWSSLGALRKCIGNPDADQPSDILDKEMIGQRGDAKVRCRVFKSAGFETLRVTP